MTNSEEDRIIIDSMNRQSDEAEKQAVDDDNVVLPEDYAEEEKYEKREESIVSRNKSNSEEEIKDFDQLIQENALMPVPNELVDDLLNSLNSYKNSGVFNEIDSTGKNRLRFPKQDLYSGEIDEVSNNPIAFPKRTGYGTQCYVRVYLEEEDLYIYVPASQAGLLQPRALTQLRFHRCSVIITDLYTQSMIRENGNNPTMYAIGSIQAAEYQIGAQLRSELVNNPKNFETYDRTGVITHINRRKQSAIINMDLRKEGKGYIDVEVPFKDLRLHYKFQRITDVKSLREGRKITVHFTGVYEREVDDKEKNIRGSYFEIKASRENMPGFYSKLFSTLNSLGQGSQCTGYIYSRTAQRGIIVEICPGFKFLATSSWRHVRDINITDADIKGHAKVSFTLKKEAQGYEGMKKFLDGKFKRPVIINGVQNVNDSNNIANHLGTYKGVSAQQALDANAKLSLENSSKPSRRQIEEAAKALFKKAGNLSKRG